jgi:CheY-like chemotaxis protein
MSEGHGPVLVVEDGDDLRDALVVLIELHGHAATAASNGAEALALLRDGLRPCLIVLDLVMPGNSGWEFRVEQLAVPELAAIPTVAISAALQGESVRKSLGVDAFLTKPVDFDALLGFIERLCASARRE